MRERLISAAVLVPVVVIIFLLGDPWLTFGIAALAGVAAVEAGRLARGAGLAADTLFAATIAIASVLATRLVLVAQEDGQLVGGAMLTLIAAAVLVSGFLALGQLDTQLGFRSWVGNLFASLYPSLLAFLAGILVIAPAIPESAALDGWLDAGRIWILVLVLTVWSFDSFAYVAGRYHGKGRFMNHISPNKTWSGVGGGTMAAIVVCTVLVTAAGQSPLGGAVLGLVIAIAAQAGDLAESVLKRAAGAKDSGNILPGHGGILDRVDSFLFAAPAMFVVLTWAQWFIPA